MFARVNIRRDLFRLPVDAFLPGLGFVESLSDLSETDFTLAMVRVCTAENSHQLLDQSPSMPFCVCVCTICIHLLISVILVIEKRIVLHT